MSGLTLMNSFQSFKIRPEAKKLFSSHICLESYKNNKIKFIYLIFEIPTYKSWNIFDRTGSSVLTKHLNEDHLMIIRISGTHNFYV